MNRKVSWIQRLVTIEGLLALGKDIILPIVVSFGVVLPIALSEFDLYTVPLVAGIFTLPFVMWAFDQFRSRSLLGDNEARGRDTKSSPNDLKKQLERSENECRSLEIKASHLASAACELTALKVKNPYYGIIPDHSRTDDFKRQNFIEWKSKCDHCIQEHLQHSLVEKFRAADQSAGTLDLSIESELILSAKLFGQCLDEITRSLSIDSLR